MVNDKTLDQNFPSPAPNPALNSGAHAPTPPPIAITTNDPTVPPMATQNGSSPEDGFAAANKAPDQNLPSPAPNPALNSGAHAPIAAMPIVLATSDAYSKGKPNVSAPPVPATLAQKITTSEAQTANNPETGFTIAENIAHNPANNPADDNVPLFAADASPNASPNTIPNFNAPAATALTTNNAPTGKPGVSATPPSAAEPLATAADKKAPPAVQPSITPSHTTAAHEVPATVAPAAVVPEKDSPAIVTPPAPTSSAAPTEVRSDAALEFPKTHQMLDSAPPVPPTPTAAPLATDPTATAQMHVGIRTDAFGAVEIHTVVQQSQIGITVHADREIARWFSSEVPGLESGLNKNHLNLTAVDFDSGRCGVQTASSFQHGQPRQHFPENSGSQSATLPNALPDQDAAPDFTTADIFPSDLPVGPAVTRVSIHA